MMYMRKFERAFCQYVLKNFARIVIAAFAGGILLSLAYCLPVDRIDQNLSNSASIFQKEGYKPSVFTWCSSELDNFTDAIILQNSAYKDAGSVLQQAMKVPRQAISGEEYPNEEVVRHYIGGEPYDAVWDYGRYWHGYLIFTKPLLFLTNYTGIRILNAIAQGCMFVTLVVLLVKRKMSRYIFPYCLSISFLVPYAMAMSLQFSSCYYILTIGSIAVLVCGGENSVKRHVFLYIGIAVAFFDFLTYPIATLGIPAVFLYCVRDHEKDSIRNSFTDGVSICYEWAFGYFGMWSAKWIIGGIITKTNILGNASEKIAERSFQSFMGKSTNILDDVSYTLQLVNESFFNTPIKWVLLLSILVLLCVAAIRLLKKDISVKQIGKEYAFAVIAVFPVLWYVIALEHSMWHYWFTCKALVVTVFAITAGLTTLAFPKSRSI